MRKLKTYILAAAILLGAAPEASALCPTGAICTAPVPKTDWTYLLCEDHAPYVARAAVWCSVRGGTWDSSIPGCIGGTPDSASNMDGLEAAFIAAYRNPCESGSSNAAPPCYNCGCTPVNDNSVAVKEILGIDGVAGKSMAGGQCSSPWTEWFVRSRSRVLVCPDGYFQDTSPQGTLCYKYPPCKTCVGNPVDVGNGEKRQRETDYAAGGGGLEFTRHYNSAGYWSLTSRLPVTTDVWRHTYSAAVHAFPAGGAATAAVVRPQGEVRFFNASGVEMQNWDGAAYRLQKLVDGGGALTGWKLTSDSDDVEMYDVQGRLTSITTRGGMATTLAYDTNARLQTVTDAFGKTLTLAYNADGLLATMTDPASRTYQYGYDSEKRLVTVAYPNSTPRTYLYEDANGKQRLTGIVDERGLRLSTYTYDWQGRASSTTRAGSDNFHSLVWTDQVTQIRVDVTDAFGAGHVYSFDRVNGVLKLRLNSTNGLLGGESRTYDANGNLASFSNRRGMVTNYTHDSTRNLETSRTEAYGTALARTITTTWHATYRQPATITEPSGVAGVNLVTEFTHDTAGNVTKKKMTAGAYVREWNYTYNGRGQGLTVNGPRTDVTDVTTMTYYADSDTCVGCRGQVYTVTNPAGHVTTFNTYSADARPTQITDANGVVTTLAYKPRGWLESRTVGGETTTYDYDTMGNLTRVMLPDASWVGYAYDAAAALVAVEDNLGNSIEYELDVLGNRVQEAVFDPQGTLKKTLQRLYDGFNRLEKDLGALGQATRYARYGYDSVTTVTDPLNRVTTNTYDILNRLTNMNDAASGNTVFTYDARDRLATVKDPKLSTATVYTYNGLGDLLTQASPDTGTTTFTYDAAGNVATQTDARSVVTTYSYDTLNRVTAATVTVTDGTVTYEYDNLTTGGAYAKGRLTKVSDPSGNTTYVYDSLGRVTSKVQATNATPTNKTFTVGYSYSSGRQTGITYPSGRAVTYGFNAAGQLTSITVDGATTILSGATYVPFGPVSGWTWGNGQAMTRSHDYDGRVKSLTLGPSTATYPDLSQVFGYDSLNRLTTAALAAGQTQSFTYDANSNRTNATVNGASTTYTYPSTSHKLFSLSGATTRSFTYDNAGSVTNSQSITYVYDGRGRMKQAGTTTYLVNGLGQRVKKAGASETYFAYDEAGRLLGEYDTAGVAIQETIWLGDLPVGVIKPATPSGFTAYYIWADHLGTPRQITDTSNVSRWEWNHNDPFGNNAPNENPAGAGAFAFNLRFPGQYFDQETGTAYNYFRTYDAPLGRYIQSDPIGLKGGINTYAYVGGNPLIGYDPLGLATFMCTKPLDALGGAGKKLYGPKSYNPLYHQFLCVTDAAGNTSCGGQDRSGSGVAPGSPGQPSKDKWPSPGSGQCTLEDPRKCMDDCVLRKITDTRRPWYAIGPHGTDCQEWADDVVLSCKAECKGKQ